MEAASILKFPSLQSDYLLGGSALANCADVSTSANIRPFVSDASAMTNSIAIRTQEIRLNIAFTKNMGRILWMQRIRLHWHHAAAVSE